MKPHIASLINALLLITLPLWSYLTSDSPSMTALIPTFIGVALLLCNPGIKSENKVIAHVAVLLTLLILFGLIKPLMGAISGGRTMGIIRVVIMMISTVIALVTFIQSFIQARKNREAAQ